MSYDVEEGLEGFNGPNGFWGEFLVRYQSHCHIMLGQDPERLPVPFELSEVDAHARDGKWTPRALAMLALAVGMVTLSNEDYAKRFLDNWPSQLDIMHMIQQWKGGAR